MLVTDSQDLVRREIGSPIPLAGARLELPACTLAADGPVTCLCTILFTGFPKP